jgi:DNA helicase TIP49 (TBP-interacting protein)
MKSKSTNYVSIRRIFGKVEIKIIFDILIQLKKIRKCRSKLFFLTGLSETGKTFSLITLSNKIGKDIPLVFSSGLWVNSFSIIKKNLLLQMSRQAIGIKFYQENFIIKGVLINLEIKNKKVNRSINFGRLTLKNLQNSKTYDISEELLKKILTKKIKIGDTLLINRTTGDIYNHTNDNLFYFEREKDQKLETNDSVEKIVITEQLVTLDELDNVNQKNNLINKYFSNQFEEINSKKKENLEEVLKKWVKFNKIKIIKGLIVIDDIEWMKIEEIIFLKELLSKFLSPSILIVSKSDVDDKNFQCNFSEKTRLVTLSDINILVPFKPVNCKELFEIIKTKCMELNIYIKRKAIGFLVKIGLNCGLKYSLYILSISILLKKKEGIRIYDIKSSYEIFLNSKRCIIQTKFQHFNIFY